MKRSARPRKTAKLSDSLHHQLNAYALAASAAGVGILALALPAKARIVYTPAHQEILPNSVSVLDLNHDGIADFTLDDAHPSSGYGTWGGLSIRAARRGDRFLGYGNFYASALPAGVPVGPKGKFFFSHGFMATTHFSGGVRYCPSFPWGNVKNRYLGLKFGIAGKVHFGWARLNVTCHPDTFTVTGLLTGYAYETIPNKPIIAGKTHGKNDATLGRLAQGASGVVSREKK